MAPNNCLGPLYTLYTAVSSGNQVSGTPLVDLPTLALPAVTNFIVATKDLPRFAVVLCHKGTTVSGSVDSPKILVLILESGRLKLRVTIVRSMPYDLRNVLGEVPGSKLLDSHPKDAALSLVSSNDNRVRSAVSNVVNKQVIQPVCRITRRPVPTVLGKLLLDSNGGSRVRDKPLTYVAPT